MSEIHDLVAKLSGGVDKLTHEVIRLRRDIAGLHARIEPFEGEVPAKLPFHDMPAPATRNLVDELARLQAARESIEACENHLNAMRSKMDQIANGSISRDEMKGWLKS